MGKGMGLGMGMGMGLGMDMSMGKRMRMGTGMSMARAWAWALACWFSMLILDCNHVSEQSLCWCHPQLPRRPSIARQQT